MNEKRLGEMKQAQQQFHQQTELPPRGDWSSAFRPHMVTTLVLDDGTRIDMGNVDIDTALRKLRREIDFKNGDTYFIDGFPDLKMRIVDQRIVALKPPSTLTNISRRLQGKNKIFSTTTANVGGRTRARKMGRKGRKGTNKRRRYIAKTRRQRRGNN